MKRSSDERPKPKLKASHVFRDLWELIWPRRNLFLLGLILTFINRAASLVLPGSTKFLIDDVVQKHRQDLLIPIAAAVAGAILIQALTSYTLIRLLSTSAQRLIAEMRSKYSSISDGCPSDITTRTRPDPWFRESCRM